MNEKESPNVKLSKSLSWLLRHGAPKSNIKIHAGGYVNLSDILTLPKFKSYTVTEVKKVVENNDKQRFTLCEGVDGQLMIRANQGHSFPVNDSELLEPIIKPDDCPLAVHGTFRRNMESIRRIGLSRMNRNHIHFAPGEPGAEGVISGMRQSAEVYIYADIAKAMQDGIKFYRSNNNVILTSGNNDGILEPKYFARIIERTNR